MYALRIDGEELNDIVEHLRHLAFRQDMSAEVEAAQDSRNLAVVVESQAVDLDAEPFVYGVFASDDGARLERLGIQIQIRLSGDFSAGGFHIHRARACTVEDGKITGLVMEDVVLRPQESPLSVEQVALATDLVRALARHPSHPDFDDAGPAHAALREYVERARLIFTDDSGVVRS